MGEVIIPEHLHLAVTPDFIAKLSGGTLATHDIALDFNLVDLKKDDQGSYVLTQAQHAEMLSIAAYWVGVSVMFITEAEAAKAMQDEV